MKYKKLVSVMTLATFIVSYLLPRCAFCVEEAEEKLREGINYVDVLYESDRAIEKFNEVTKSKKSSLRLKVKAYFWLAYTYLFEGNIEKAQSTFTEMFKVVSNQRYNFTKRLSPSIVQNEELMGLYESAKKKAYEEKHPPQKSSRGPAKFESSKRIILEGREMFRDLAIEEFKKVIKSEDSPIELKVSAYFWLAYTYLLEGKTDKSYNVFITMLEDFQKPNYDYTAHLDPEIISDNNKLLGLFKQAKDVYVKSIEENNIRVKKRKRIEKNFTKKLIPIVLAVGYIIVMGLAISK